MKHSAKEAPLVDSDELVSKLLLIFTKEGAMKEKGAAKISALQHREHLEDHVRSFAALSKGIGRELLAWHVALRTQGDFFGKQKPLVMTVATHLTRVQSNLSTSELELRA